MTIPVIPASVNTLFHPCGYFDPGTGGGAMGGEKEEGGNAAKSLMNIAELETAALSGKFRELRATTTAEGEGRTTCRDKLSKRRAAPGKLA